MPSTSLLACLMVETQWRQISLPLFVFPFMPADWSAGQRRGRILWTRPPYAYDRDRYPSLFWGTSNARLHGFCEFHIRIHIYKLLSSYQITQYQSHRKVEWGGNALSCEAGNACRGCDCEIVMGAGHFWGTGGNFRPSGIFIYVCGKWPIDKPCLWY